MGKGEWVIKDFEYLVFRWQEGCRRRVPGDSPSLRRLCPTLIILGLGAVPQAGARFQAATKIVLGMSGRKAGEPRFQGADFAAPPGLRNWVPGEKY